MQNNENKKLSRNDIGKIGETLVNKKLRDMGWDAFNANTLMPNYRAIDIVCINNNLSESEDKPWKPRMELIQVKMCRQRNIPIGCNIAQSLDRDYLEKHIKGAYVMIHYEEKDGETKYDYYIISRKQFIELTLALHKWYVYDFDRDKDLNLKATAGLDIKALEGFDYEATKRHKPFINPLKGETCKDKWENIWRD